MPFDLSPWQSPPEKPDLVGGEVHLWRFPLAGPPALAALLAADELQRAGRLRLPAKARAFVTARARLRQVLALYLDLAPQQLTFTYGAAGKPSLGGELPRQLAFSLAHAGNWGLCAVVAGAQVGVDLEWIDRGLDFEKLAAHFFSAAERRKLQECHPLRRRRCFFRIWTRKEAWLKGKGGGFADPDQDLSPTHLDGCCTHDGSWWLRSFCLDRHTLGALALSRKASLLQRWNGWCERS